MNEKIDIKNRLRSLASGEITGEIPSFEYSFAADKIEQYENCLIEIMNLSAGFDNEGPKEPFTWETVARIAIDYAKSAINK